MTTVRAANASVQLTWVDGRVMAWDPTLSPTARAQLLRDPAVHTVALDLPGGQVSVPCRPLDHVALDHLALDRLADGTPSRSVAWFAACQRFAREAVRRGRVVPVLEPVEGRSVYRTGAAWWNATWRPLDADLAGARHTIGPAMPPVVAASGEPTDTVLDRVIIALVDTTARSMLAAKGWHAVLHDLRSPSTRAVRLVGRALIAPDGRFSAPPDLLLSVEHLADEFERMGRRAAGEPVVRARLRLDTPPDDIADDDPRWPLALELVDVDDASRWCAWSDVVARRPRAVALAGDDHLVDLLHREGRAALASLGEAVGPLQHWSGRHLDQPERADTISTDEATALLDSFDDLRPIGLELIAPERLVRRRPTPRGTARPEPTDGSGRLGATALVEWTLVVDDTPVDEHLLQLAAEQGAELLQVGGRWVRIERAEAQRALAAIAEHRHRHGQLAPLALLQLCADAVGETATDLSLRGEGWAEHLLAGLPEIDDGVVPDGFTATLRPYQRRGLGWLQWLYGLGLGGCLADDMGLGKTPTTLAHLCGVPGPHLVVCPLSVVRNWEQEAARFVPHTRVLVHHGTARAHGTDLADEAGRVDLVITTYQVATRDIEALRSVPWGVVVLDEAQMVKNPDTRSARALRTIEARQHIALTGTPVENRLRELWSIFHIVVPGLLGSAARFRERFATPIERHRDPSATAALRSLTGPFLLRRTKADRSLVPDLPDKVEQIAWSTLTREQAAMYQAVVATLFDELKEAGGMQRRGLVLAALTRLKQICNHPAHALGDGSRLAGRSGKLHRFDELVTDFTDAGERALVFTQFVEMGELLQRHLAERFHLTIPFLHGSVPRARRDRMVASFQTDADAPPLLLVSLRAGGVGLNLTAASRVVHYDRWWNPAVEDQATDRAWRIGQQRSVFVHKLVCEGTVEERIDALINDKRALARAVIGSEDWITELDDDALRALVALDTPSVRHS